MKIIIEVTFNNKPLVVEEVSPDLFQVKLDGVVKHPNLKTEDVIRVLGFYMHNSIKN